MKFVKMHGAGNDFVIVDAVRQQIDQTALQAASRTICDRHFGVGSDGLIVVLPGESSPFQMRMYNPDGSEAEMCGNGIRCFAKYVFDSGLTTDTSIQIETLAGTKGISLSTLNGKAERVRVDMGVPGLEPESMPVKASGDDDGVVRVSLDVGGKDFVGTCVSMGVPHCVIRVDDDVDRFPVTEIGPLVENHRLFPRRTNAPFVQVVSPTQIRLRVWERGAGETLACGTGACATVVACALNGWSSRKASVELPGGVLEIEWAPEGHVLMDGPAAEVFEGTYLL